VPKDKNIMPADGLNQVSVNNKIPLPLKTRREPSPINLYSRSPLEWAAIKKLTTVKTKTTVSTSRKMEEYPFIGFKLVSHVCVSMDTPRAITRVATIITIITVLVFCTSSPAAQTLAVQKEKMLKHLIKSRVLKAKS
jgi:hypothetical protein